MKRQKKQYGVQIRFRSSGFVVPKRFLEDEFGDEEREDVIGQPNDKSDVAPQR